MGNNPTYCSRCAHLGMKLGVAEAEVRELRLQLRLRCGLGRRDIVRSPLEHRHPPDPTW